MNHQPNPNQQQFDKGSFLAILLCIGIYFAYDYYMRQKYPQQNPVQTQTEQVNGAVDSGDVATVDKAPQTSGSLKQGSASTNETPSVEVEQLSSQDLTIATDVVTYRFDQANSGIKSVTLQNYNDSVGKKAQPINLAKNGFALQPNVDNEPAELLGFAAKRDGRRVTFSKQVGSWRLTQEYTVPETGYELEVVAGFENTGVEPKRLTSGVKYIESIPFAKKGSFLPGVPSERPTFIFKPDAESTDWEDIEELCRSEESNPVFGLADSSLNYFGLDKHYFLKVLTPDSKMSVAVNRANLTESGCDFSYVASQKQGLVPSGGKIELKFRGFFGPKDLKVLSGVGRNLPQAVDFGMFSFLAEPLLIGVKGFKDVLGNYGLSIILMTVLLKVLFFPLMNASAKSMHAMKKLNPQMQALREKYKDDRQKQQQELMKFMAQHKINPMKGCLPILPQIPVFFAFYQVLLHSIDLRHAPFYFWIHDLSVKDPYYVTPVLMGIAMFIQQKLTPTTGMDKAQEKVMMMMPIMFAVMMATLPAGMTLYMLINTALTIVQQKWLYFKLDKQENN